MKHHETSFETSDITSHHPNYSLEANSLDKAKYQCYTKDMGTPLEELLQKPLPEIKGMSKDALRLEVELWRTIFGQLPEEVRDSVARIGGLVRVVRRDYKGTLGIWQLPKLEATELRVLTREKFYDGNVGRYYWEDKLVYVPQSAVMFMEFLSERDLAVDEAITGEEVAHHPTLDTPIDLQEELEPGATMLKGAQ